MNEEEILGAFLLVNDYRILTNEELEDNKLSIRSAKEMFEELGFIKDNYSYEYRRYREWDVSDKSMMNISHRNGTMIIHFYENSKDIEIYSKENGFATVVTLDYKLLRAINKQVEELGWNK